MNDYELLLEYNKILQLEIEKLNHYKTLYNVLKDRKDKAIEYINNNQLVFSRSTKEQINEWFSEFYKNLLKILE